MYFEKQMTQFLVFLYWTYCLYGISKTNRNNERTNIVVRDCEIEVKCSNNWLLDNNLSFIQDIMFEHHIETLRMCNIQ